MKTRYISWDEALGYKKDELEYAAGVLREGGLVAFPTGDRIRSGRQWSDERSFREDL